MPGPVGDELDQVLGGTEQIDEGLHQVEVGNVISRAHVVDTADFPLRPDRPDGLTVIEDVQPLT